MSKHSFTDSDGDEYTVSAAGEHNIALTYRNPETGGVDLFIFKVEDADRIAAMILDAAQEARK